MNNLIKTYREKSNMSQSELARRLGVTSACVSSWEKWPDRAITHELRVRLKGVLGIPLSNESHDSDKIHHFYAKFGFIDMLGDEDKRLLLTLAERLMIERLIT